MTTVTIHSGICGFSVTVTAEKAPDRKVSVSLDTDCEMVRKMTNDVSLLDMMAAFTGFQSNAVHRSAAKHLKHVACPVPSGILKAIEVELGFALPKDASILFAKKG